MLGSSIVIEHKISLESGGRGFLIRKAFISRVREVWRKNQITEPFFAGAIKTAIWKCSSCADRCSM